MTRPAIYTALFALLVAAALAAPRANADVLGVIPSGWVGQVRDSTQEVLRDGISLDEAVSRAEAQYNARVVRAEADERNGRVIYKLRLLSDDGRVFTVRVDAQSGAIY
jgi:Peptidase propeptide and YPEB domain